MFHRQTSPCFSELMGEVKHFHKYQNYKSYEKNKESKNKRKGFWGTKNNGEEFILPAETFRKALWSGGV